MASVFLALTHCGFAVVVEWDPNPESNIGGYRVYWGRQSRGYESVIDVGTNTLAQLPTPSVQTFYAVTAYDTDGLESDFSAEVFFTPATQQNRTPIVAADAYSTPYNQTLVVGVGAGVLINDSDADGDPLFALAASLPASGALTFNGNGSFTYQPANNFSGTVQFGYRATDGKSTSTVTTVTLTVSPPPNNPPVAVSDSYTTAYNQPLVVGVASGLLANDSDANGDPLSAMLVSIPASGTLTFNANGSFSYQPANNFSGIAQFSYRATDGKSTSAVATVTLTVNPAPNEPPVVVPDSYTTEHNQPLIVSAASGVLANDSDANGDPLAALLVSFPSSGALTFNVNGSFTYQPANNFSGTVQFSYRATDSKSTSAVATVSVTVNSSTNRPPAAFPESYSTPQNEPLTVAVAAGVLSNDEDEDGDVLSALLVSSPSSGTLVLNADGSFTYEPASSFIGSVQFGYRATDGTSTSEVAVVTLTVNASPNQVPVAAADSYTAWRNQPLNINAASGVLANDGDGDGDSLTAVLVSAPLSGTLSLSANGSFTYQPALDFAGPVQFLYAASDGKSTSAVVVVTVIINSSAVPVAVMDAYGTWQNQTLKVGATEGVLSNDTDADGDALSAFVVLLPASGALVLQANGGFTFQPASNFIGTVQFAYRMTDGQTTSGVAMVSIVVNPPLPPGNQPPVAATDSYAAAKNQTLVVPAATGVLANDSDPDGQPIGAILISSPSAGVLTFNANGSFAYEPPSGFTGLIQFSYAAVDGESMSSITTVFIGVGEATCEDCLTQLEASLAGRAQFLNALHSILAMYTNGTCLDLTVNVFGTLARMLGSNEDPLVSEALTRASDCIAQSFNREFDLREQKAATLSASRWTTLASNKVSSARGFFNQLQRDVSPMLWARAFVAASKSIARADNALVSGDVAPTTLRDGTFEWKKSRTEKWVFVFTPDLFVLETADGIQVTQGTYAYSRTAWNAGQMLISFDNPLFGAPANQILAVDLKFSPVTGRMKGDLRGTLRRVR